MALVFLPSVLTCWRTSRRCRQGAQVGQGQEGGQPVHKDHFVSKMFTWSPSCCGTLRDPRCAWSFCP
ncbi:hypothetical protein PR003_g28552 [Phytophthora rubi]|uniref:Uncharacterized protein n=1 Tax=Phytophthora rubi TaxID=129364 RepID=A0A6A3NAS7_9STRA|nr:hypothetical protein PR001_g27376 [Phytophthora rubi]KAE9038667.1 hypothetical protein PR002_g5904 [Phytophthora rubi]KAE9278351.1 hypothetical protein PR003_g28552 [Phytophthora rubi]